MSPSVYQKPFRKQVEQWLRRDFTARGGTPRAPYPIYMIPGRPGRMEALDAATRATIREILVPLSTCGECDLSFTYPYSLVSFRLSNQTDSEYYQSEYNGRGLDWFYKDMKGIQ